MERIHHRPDGTTGYTWAHYIPDVQHGQVVGRGRGENALDDGLRRGVAAHRVDRDADHAWATRLRATLFLADRADLSLVIEAAVGADPVGRLRLVALRAEPGGGGTEGVVGTALGRAGLGVSTFWIWHDDSSTIPSP